MEGAAARPLAKEFAPQSGSMCRVDDALFIHHHGAGLDANGGHEERFPPYRVSGSAQEVAGELADGQGHGTDQQAARQTVGDGLVQAVEGDPGRAGR